MSSWPSPPLHQRNSISLHKVSYKTTDPMCNPTIDRLFSSLQLNERNKKEQEELVTYVTLNSLSDNPGAIKKVSLKLYIYM